MSEPLDPAAIMAEHDCTYDSRGVEWCPPCYASWPCEPYRLAEALAAERAKPKCPSPCAFCDGRSGRLRGAD